MKSFLRFFDPLLSFKPHIIVGVVCVFICLSVFICWPDKNKVGIIDLTKIYENALVFKAIHDQQVSFEESWKKEALAEKEKLEKDDIELSRKKGRLKKSKFEKEAKALKERILDFQNQQMAKLDLIRYQTSLIQQRVSEKIRPIIADVSVRKNLIFVLPVSEVLYHNNTVDITDEVIKSLDDAYNEGDLPDLEISLQEGV